MTLLGVLLALFPLVKPLFLYKRFVFCKNIETHIAKRMRELRKKTIYSRKL